MMLENQSFLDDFLIILHRYRLVIGIIFGICGAAGAAISYWYFSQISRDEAAQLALAEIYTDVANARYNNELWQEVEIAAKTGRLQFARSNLAAYFLLVEVDALLAQEKLDQASLIMKDFLSSLKKENPFYYIFNIKSARMDLDSADKVRQKHGLDQLLALSRNTANPQQDEALYYVGFYYQSKGMQQLAIDTWKELIAFKQADQTAISPWVEQAKKALQEIV